MTELETEVVSFDNIYKAYWEVARGKRDKEEFLAFHAEYEDNLIEIQDDLIWRTYEPLPTVSFWVREPKLRLITRPQIRDRIVHHALIRVVQPIFEKNFHPASYACRPGRELIEASVMFPGGREPFLINYMPKKKGTHIYPKALPFYAAKEYVRNDIHERYPDAEIKSVTLREGRGQLSACRHYSALLRSALGKYGNDFTIIQIDLKSYFRSIDHNIIIGLLCWMFHEDPFICWLFATIISSVEEGLPIGFLPSQHEANLAGTVIDFFSTGTCDAHMYVRYMDDIRILCPDRETAKDTLARIDELCTRCLRLSLSETKTHIIQFKGYDTFCGYRVFPHHLEAKTTTVKRGHRRLEKKIGELEAGLITPQHLRVSAQSLLAYLGPTNTPDDEVAEKCLQIAKKREIMISNIVK